MRACVQCVCDPPKRKNNDLKKSAKQVADELHEVNLESDTTAKAVKEAVKEKEDRMVAHDVLKLEVKRLRDRLNARADEVFSLENRKMQLQLSMEERKHEVEVHRELLAARRGGIPTVLIPEENVKDLADIAERVTEGLEIVPVSHVDEVLSRALVREPDAIEWTEADDLASQPVNGVPFTESGQTTH